MFHEKIKANLCVIFIVANSFTVFILNVLLFKKYFCAILSFCFPLNGLILLRRIR